MRALNTRQRVASAGAAHSPPCGGAPSQLACSCCWRASICWRCDSSCMPRVAELANVSSGTAPIPANEPFGLRDDGGDGDGCGAPSPRVVLRQAQVLRAVPASAGVSARRRGGGAVGGRGARAGEAERAGEEGRWAGRPRRACSAFRCLSMSAILRSGRAAIACRIAGAVGRSLRASSSHAASGSWCAAGVQRRGWAARTRSTTRRVGPPDGASTSGTPSASIECGAEHVRRMPPTLLCCCDRVRAIARSACGEPAAVAAVSSISRLPPSAWAR